MNPSVHIAATAAVVAVIMGSRHAFRAKELRVEKDETSIAITKKVKERLVTKVKSLGIRSSPSAKCS